ncbi:MAG TPA: SRPBCC family protein [Povalibacter sp.]
MHATRTITILFACGLAAVVRPARAEIVSAGPAGFNLRQVTETAGVPPSTVWAALTDVGKWWDPEHTYSGDARNLSLDPQPRGCLCERLGLYAGIEHAHVVYAQPAKTLRLIGSLGPLQEFGVTGSLTWQIEAAGGGSRITVTYNVGGYADRPLADWAPIVDEVIAAQVKRLGRFVVTGNPAEAKTEGRP